MHDTSELQGYTKTGGVGCVEGGFLSSTAPTYNSSCMHDTSAAPAIRPWQPQSCTLIGTKTCTGSTTEQSNPNICPSIATLGGLLNLRWGCTLHLLSPPPQDKDPRKRTNNSKRSNEQAVRVPPQPRSRRRGASAQASGLDNSRPSKPSKRPNPVLPAAENTYIYTYDACLHAADGRRALAAPCCPSDHPRRTAHARLCLGPQHKGGRHLPPPPLRL